MKKLLIAFTVFMLGFVLVGCGENGNVDEFSEKGFETGGVSQEDYDNLGAELVGTWQRTNLQVTLTWQRGQDYIKEIIFNADGTGYGDGIFFEWKLNGKVISMEFEDGDVEEWEYSINNDVLAIVILGSDQFNHPKANVREYERID